MNPIGTQARNNTLPSDWEIKRLGQISKVATGGTPSRECGAYWNGTIPWITTSLIDFDIIESAEELITPEAVANSAAKVFPKGTLLMAMFGQGVTRGKVGILGIDAAFNQACVGITPLPIVDTNYLFQYLAFNYETIRNLANSGSQENLNASLIKGIEVNVPPLPEQKAIAAVLSTWDRAIAQTSALIAAKERLKAGLMQQLMTSKRRFKGFKGEWRRTHIGELATESSERNGDTLPIQAVHSVTKANGIIPMPEDIVGSDISRYKVVRRKAFAYNPMRINVGSIARWDGNDSVLVSPDYVVFECGSQLDPDYFNHFRRSHVWESFIKRSGDGSVRVRIYFDHLAEMPIRIPGVKEQRMIARLLNAADVEISAAKRRRESLKKQKRGLMQQLLTGKVRVSGKLLKQGAGS